MKSRVARARAALTALLDGSGGLDEARADSAGAVHDGLIGAMRQISGA
jgi:hypothetical protein